MLTLPAAKQSSFNKTTKTVRGKAATALLRKLATCNFIKAGLVERPHEELETNDGVDDDDEEDEEGDVDEGDDGHEDGVHDDLETRHTRDQSQGSQHSESSKSLHIKTLNL